jgi:hypothetical protein
MLLLVGASFLFAYNEQGLLHVGKYSVCPEPLLIDELKVQVKNQKPNSISSSRNQSKAMQKAEV